VDIRQLRYFEAVARHRHFTRAAEELHVAQSALSHQVRGLERELGVELLRRTTRSVEPTEAGALVAVRARTVLAETAALRDELEELRGLVRGHLGVGAMLFGGQLDIPAILASFTATFPDVELGVREGTAQRMVEMLAEGSVDVAFALEVEPPPGVERLALSSEELAVATAPRHELAGGAPLPIARLQGHRLIAFGAGSNTRRLVDRALADAGVVPRIAVEANDLALVRALAASGLGVALMPRSFAELPGPPVSVRPLSPALRMTVVLWWTSGRRLQPAARAFVDFVDEHRPVPDVKQPAPHSRAPRARRRRSP
jgi:DNA-binding transcriptional LysR family regulator